MNESPAWWAGDRLLKSKIMVPLVRSPVCGRERLQTVLEEVYQHALTLVSAPAGFGKSTLVAEWARRQRQVVAWLSLDPAENDPARFCKYVIAALAYAGDLSESTLNTGREMHLLPPSMMFEAIAAELERQTQPLALVLDDFHLINSQPIQVGLANLLNHMPAMFHLVILTRADPVLPLARLRASGALLELRSHDLRFTPEEAAAFLNEQMGLSLDHAEVEILEKKTEGWIAGLQLAALSLQGREDPHAFIQTFSGSHRFILDYLVEEVLARQPANIQSFLLRTSILEKLTASLCDAVLGVSPEASPAGTMLDYLDRNNLFLIALDDDREWFRYHHLFADLLRARLAQMEPALAPQLHQLAADWYEGSRYISDAIQHAFSAQNFEMAARLIEQHGMERWAASDRAFLLSTRQLPPEMLTARPLLGILQIWTTILYGQIPAAAQMLAAFAQRLDAAREDDRYAALRGFVELLQVYVASLLSQPPRSDLPAPQALDFIPDQNLAMRNTADVIYAMMLSERGKFAQAEEILTNTIRRDIAAQGTTAVPISAGLLASNTISQGKLQAAAGLCRQYIDYLNQHAGRHFYLPGNLYIPLADVFREWNQLEEAENLAREGIRLNDPWNIPLANLNGRIILARILLARGKLAEAQSVTERVDRFIEKSVIAPEFISKYRALQTRVWWETGQVERVRVWSAAASEKDLTDLRYIHEAILLARHWLHAGRTDTALDLLQKIHHTAGQGDYSGRMIQILLLEAMALFRLSRRKDAFLLLEECLRLAEPQGYCRTFLDEGPAALALLQEYTQIPSTQSGNYAQQLIRQFRSVSAAPDTRQAQAGLVEPLTARELEVLQMLAAGDSNQAIATTLCITISAVKKHVGNILGKLGVESRTQAAAAARKLGLLTNE